MIKYFIVFIFVFFVSTQLIGQLIYERTYRNAHPSLKEAFELSDNSTVSFANNTTCYFGAWRHISPSGDIIDEGGLPCESTHHLRAKQIAPDSFLVSFRTGPIDFDRGNYFRVVLWTPDSMTTLVNDSIGYLFWEDREGSNTPIHYEAFLLVDNHVLYQRGDTLFSKSLLTGSIDFMETFFHITHVYPVRDGLMVFSASLPPTYFNSSIEPVNTWLNLSAHHISFNTMVAMDSFIVGIDEEIPTSLHAVNAYTEHTVDVDLSGYFTQIDSIVVRGDILIATG